ncbi:MAG: ribonuclease P protein component [Leptolyngbyaceae cyanobacterium T60_A2020_046]|nr:ribonuclease P protein component [Leptolyngbyaceae cyanobacterium T60_A2020_046]
MALPKLHRLNRPKEFAAVYRQGQRASAAALSVIVLPVSPEGVSVPSRFGISVSQKVHKRAVVRNRLKRQVRSAIQSLIPKVKSNLWIVIVLRPSAVRCDYWQFLRQLEHTFAELEVIDGHTRGCVL